MLCSGGAQGRAAVACMAGALSVLAFPLWADFLVRMHRGGVSRPHSRLGSLRPCEPCTPFSVAPVSLLPCTYTTPHILSLGAGACMGRCCAAAFQLPAATLRADICPQLLDSCAHLHFECPQLLPRRHDCSGMAICRGATALAAAATAHRACALCFVHRRLQHWRCRIGGCP